MGKFNVEVGGKSTTELKKEYPDSCFLESDYDAAIMGINPMTESIIYHFYEVIDITMKQFTDEEIEGLGLDEDEFYNYCQERVFEEFDMLEKNESLMPPTLFQEIE